MTTTVTHRYAVTKALEYLQRRYGAEWDAKWAKLPEGELLNTWADELAVFAAHPEAITWALHHLPDRAPNAMQFRRLADQAPRAPVEPTDSLPVRGPTSLERAALQVLRDRVAADGLFARPGREWAHRLVERARVGQRVSYMALRMALEVVEGRAAAPSPAAEDLPDYWEPPTPAKEPTP